MSQLPPRRDFNSYGNSNRDSNSSSSGNRDRSRPPFGARRPSMGAPRPAPRRPVRPKGPARPMAIQPASGKERRRMLKAAAWRLAHLLSVRPAEVMTADENKLDDLIRQVEVPKPVKGTAPGRVTSLGPIIRLAEKVRRLKEKA